MKYQVTLETAIIITKYAISPVCCWPLSTGSSSLAILRHNICFWIGIVNLIIAFGGSLYSIYVHRYDISRVVKIIAEFFALVAVLMKMVICQMEAPRLQGLIGEMNTFLKQATREEKEFIQTYVDKCLMPHTIMLFACIVGSVSFIIGPLLTSQPYPGDAVFPISSDSYWAYTFCYMTSSLAVVQVGCTVLVDFLFAILLWYAGARLQILAMEFRKATITDDVRRCVRKHQAMIGYIEELKTTVGIMALEVTVCTILTVTAGGFVLIQRLPIYELAKYLFFEIGSVMELFLYAWPADNLIEVSENLGYAAYSCDWIGKSPEMLNDLLIVIQRSRIPMVVSVQGILPVLSLEFYGSTISATFSYLTALRAITEEKS